MRTGPSEFEYTLNKGQLRDSLECAPIGNMVWEDGKIKLKEYNTLDN
jgi:hypothetical protein